MTDGPAPKHAYSGIDELTRRIARTSITLLEPRPQLMVLQELTIRRDGTGADIEEVRLKIGVNVLMAASLRKNEMFTFGYIAMHIIPAFHSLTLESDAPVYVDSVRLTEMTFTASAIFASSPSLAQQGPMPVAYGFVSSEPILQPPPKNIPKPTPLPVDKDGKIKSFIETLEDKK